MPCAVYLCAEPVWRIEAMCLRSALSRKPDLSKPSRMRAMSSTLKSSAGICMHMLASFLYRVASRWLTAKTSTSVATSAGDMLRASSWMLRSPWRNREATNLIRLSYPVRLCTALSTSASCFPSRSDTPLCATSAKERICSSSRRTWRPLACPCSSLSCRIATTAELAHVQFVDHATCICRSPRRESTPVMDGSSASRSADSRFSVAARRGKWMHSTFSCAGVSPSSSTSGSRYDVVCVPGAGPAAPAPSDGSPTTCASTSMSSSVRPTVEGRRRVPVTCRLFHCRMCSLSPCMPSSSPRRVPLRALPTFCSTRTKICIGSTPDSSASPPAMPELLVPCMSTTQNRLLWRSISATDSRCILAKAARLSPNCCSHLYPKVSEFILPPDSRSSEIALS
mmetsp:Transcript_7576/g.18420  ORF Transcript_7576/g.18420 Transcript_7576/m.18420 type:complete len:396 (-) Transcript_7576:354-1541(-)